MTGLQKHEIDFDSARKQIPALSRVIYMNTGTSGPVPEPAASEVRRLFELINAEGPAVQWVGELCDRKLDDTRLNLSRILGCSREEVCLTENASDGISLIAFGMSWSPGDQVIVSDLEHISGLLPWSYLRDTAGVEPVVLETSGPNLDPELIQKAITSRTRLICISHVSYSTGAVLPVKEAARIAREHGIRILVDGAQSAGQLPLSMSELGCDYYAVPGQKWLLGPEGTGGLFVRKDRLAELRLSRIGWASIEHEDDLDEYRVRTTARKFEVATFSAPLYAGLSASIDFLRILGIDNIRERISGLASSLKQRLSEIRGVSVITPMNPRESAGLVSFTIEDSDPAAVVRRLYDEYRIVSRWVPRPLAVRMSVNFFNTEEEIETLTNAVARIARETGA